MAAPTYPTTLEQTIPVVQEQGLNTLKNINFDSGSNTCALPASTTIGGSAVVALGDITSSATTGTAFTVTGSGVYTGTGLVSFIGNSATTGVLALMTANGLTTGTVLSLVSTGTIVTTGEVLNIAANTATTATGLVRISGTGLTDGWGIQVTSGGANLTASGGGVDVVMGAATVGTGVRITSTGVYTGTTGLLAVTGNSATTGTVTAISGTGLTSGKGLVVTAAAATLTTGRYFSANDGSLEVLGIGANGHIHTSQTTAPTVATNSTGLSAVAVTAGSTDVAGTITSTGTPQSGTVITLTFHKTYTTAPKVCVYTPANAAAGGVNTMPIVTTTATTAVFTWPGSGTYAATPSWTYLVVA